jgi:DNA-binding phage protein
MFIQRSILWLSYFVITQWQKMLAENETAILQRSKDLAAVFLNIFTYSKAFTAVFLNIFTRSKGLAATAAKTECTKTTLGS